MRIIAHRGNLNGPNPSEENKIEYLQTALNKGFDVEVDVWKIGQDLMLGHDAPTYPVDRSFLCNKRVWTHAKNIEAFCFLTMFKDVNVFYQTEEDVALTSRGFFWAHSKTNLIHTKAIRTCLEYDFRLTSDTTSYGICTDYSEFFYKNMELEFSDSKPFKLLVIDIDGVMTDGTKIYGLQGEVLSKKYCDLDFTAIKRFKAAGVKVCFLSGDTTVNEKMAASRQIDFYHARLPDGNIDKAQFLSKLRLHYSVNDSEIAYVGDDYYDLSIIESLKHTFCPSTANGCIKERCSTVLSTPGGHGVIAEIYELFKDQLDYAFPVDSREVNPK